MQAKVKGFTLTELLIVVMIIGILAAVGYPMYTAQVERTNRSTVQGQMMAAATALETYKSQNFSYDGATLANLAAPLDNNEFYDATLTIGANDQTFEILVTPKGGSIMDDSGALKMDDEGQTCWAETDDTDCTFGTDKSWSDH